MKRLCRRDCQRFNDAIERASTIARMPEATADLMHLQSPLRGLGVNGSLELKDLLYYLRDALKYSPCNKLRQPEAVKLCTRVLEPHQWLVTQQTGWAVSRKGPPRLYHHHHYGSCCFHHASIRNAMEARPLAELPPKRTTGLLPNKRNSG